MLLLILVSLFLETSYHSLSLLWGIFQCLACKNTAIKLFFSYSLCMVPCISGNIHQFDSICDKVTFDEMV